MSDNENINNFQEICRVCLNLVDKNLINISVSNVVEMLMACTPVKVFCGDELPQQICTVCNTKLQDSYNFWQLSSISDQKLREILQQNYNLEPPENSYEIIKDDYLDNSPISNSDSELPLSDLKKENTTCDICNKVFLNKHKLKKHSVAHSNYRPYQCNLCPKAFKEKFILNKHLKTIHRDPTRHKVCQLCGKSIVKTSLERHLKTHENPPSFQCTQCTKKFLDDETLEKHVRRVHNKETSLDLYPFLCNTCGKGLISKSELKRHMNSHLKEPSFKCTKCTKEYTSHAGLRSHIKVFHLNERPFICSVCSRAFPTKIILKHHMRTHTGEKPYKCLICMKMFALKCVLTTHLKIHDF